MGWTDEQLNEWYGHTKTDLTPDQRDIAGGVLWLLSGHAQQRAMIAWHMAWAPALEASGTEWMVPYLGHLLTDPYSPVRYIAWQSLSAMKAGSLPKYRHLSSRKHRSEVKNEVINTWLSEASPPKVPSAHLLLNEAGQLNIDEYIRLAKSRDDRPLFLEE